ncbi:MAG TPA: matrixin family metalloprotease, partial [Myxococcota bacterium]|nr:matrixin family metalloprotease [Myxococcota bacterium]
MKPAWLLGAAAALAPGAALGFVLLGPVWSGGSAPLHVGALDGTAFRTALISAADAWEDASDFEFDEDFAGRGACDRNIFGRGELEEGAEFERRDCDGFLLGSDVLAVTQYETRSGRFSSVGLVFNDDLDWAVYDGPWRGDEPDFRRVALHELGHWLGLDHENSPLAIMSSFAGDLDALAPDDVAGVRFLYGPSDEPPPPDPGDPLDPAAACRRDELRAARALCEVHFECEAKRAGAPERDPLGLARDACADRARGRFERRYGEARTRAAAAGASCPGTLDAAAAAALVTVPAGEIEAGLLVGADPPNPTDARLRRKLLAAAGAACDAGLRAEARFVRDESQTQLDERRARARVRFLDRANAAIDRALDDGVSYAGTPPVEAA